MSAMGDSVIRSMRGRAGSTIERLAELANKISPDQWVSIFAEIYDRAADLEQQLEAAERRNAELVAERDALREAIEKHRYDVWGYGAVACEIDERLYATLAHSAQESADAAE